MSVERLKREIACGGNSEQSCIHVCVCVCLFLCTFVIWKILQLAKSRWKIDVKAKRGESGHSYIEGG